MPAYDFGSGGQVKPPRASSLAQFLQVDLKGLDMVSPVDLMKSGRTPYAKNFRLYAQQSDDRQVAVSNRKGSGFYMNPLGETKTLSQESVTGAATQSIGVVLNNVLEKFTAPNSNRLSRLDIKLANPGTGRGTVLVEIWSDNAGQPYSKLATSSFENGDISVSADYITARFIQAPKLTSGSTYWIVLKVQDDGADGYTVSTTTNTALAYVSNTGVTSPVAQTFSINYKLYTTAENAIRGIYRWNRDNSNNLTIVVIGTTMYYVNESTNTLVSFKTGLNANATYYSFTNADNKLFWVNSYDPLTYWDGTTVNQIVDADLEILSQIEYHKDRLFGVSAANKNKIMWSEAPGNPTAITNPTTGVQTPTTASQQWYNAWKSTSFQYVPRPYIGSPITSIQSFQDSLFIFTQDGKYVFSGYDAGSYTLRESTGFAGAVSAKSVCITKNFMYFVGKDGFWQFDGTNDKKISEPIEPLFRAMTSREDVTVAEWKNQVRFYIQENGSAYNNACVIYHEGLDELQYDTDTWIQQAIPYDDADDSDQLIEVSSLVPTMYIAEQGYSHLGMPIDFEYRLSYTSLKSPAQKKRIKKFFPLLQGVDTSFPLTVGLDRDFQNSPRTKIVNLTVDGGTFGQDHEFGDGLEFGGGTSFKQHRLRFSGYGNYWQIRVSRKAVNNRVALVGAQFSYKMKRI